MSRDWPLTRKLRWSTFQNFVAERAVVCTGLGPQCGACSLCRLHRRHSWPCQYPLCLSANPHRHPGSTTGAACPTCKCTCLLLHVSPRHALLLRSPAIQITRPLTRRICRTGSSIYFYQINLPARLSDWLHAVDICPMMQVDPRGKTWNRLRAAIGQPNFY